MIIPSKKGSDDLAVLEAVWVGRLDYEEGYRLQRRFHEQRRRGLCPDTLLLLEHPLTFTLPRRSRPSNLRLGREELQARGAEVVETDRGGEVTLHNPGQLIGYLIVDLAPGSRDLHSYLRWIEERLIDLAGRFEIEARRREKLTGVWVADRKLASIGIAVKRWVTLHGFALNVNNDLRPFEWIHPCGLKGVRMTSLARERGHAVLWGDLLEEARKAFGAEWSHESSRDDFPPSSLNPAGLTSLQSGSSKSCRRGWNPV